MAVRQKPAKFEATDGTEFTDQEAAERHDILLLATRDFEQARDRLNIAAAATQKTADGVPFDARSWRAYWYLAEWINGGPQIFQVTFGYSTRFELEGYGDSRNSKLAIVVWEEERGSRTFARRTYKIEELYHDERNAKKALAEALNRFITDREEYLAKLIKENERQR